MDEGVRRLGVEDDHMTMAARTKLTSAIEAATGVGAPTFNAAIELKDVADATMQIRMVKSVEEIALITAGANVADVGGAAAKAAIEAAGPGIREYEVALASTTAMVHEIAARYPGADLMDTWTWFQVRPRVVIQKLFPLLNPQSNSPRRPNNSRDQQPNNPTTQQPNNPTTQEPNNPTNSSRVSTPTARTIQSPTARSAAATYCPSTRSQ